MKKCFGFLTDKTDRDRYTSRIEWIRYVNRLQVFYQEVTREEKDIIVKAVGLAQGHWFKCPNGEHHRSMFRYTLQSNTIQCNAIHYLLALITPIKLP